jgi:hypothetical protein
MTSIPEPHQDPLWQLVGTDDNADDDGAPVDVDRHQDERLLTTNHVRGESWTLVNRREGHAAAVRFLDALAASPACASCRSPRAWRQRP